MIGEYIWHDTNIPKQLTLKSYTISCIIKWANFAAALFAVHGVVI